MHAPHLHLVERYFEYEKAFGEHIKMLREQRSLSQADLAFLAGVEQNQISRVESAKHGITLSTIIAIAVALGYEPDKLFRIEVKLDLNSNFNISARKRLPITATLRKLLSSNYLDTPRSVSQIVSFCRFEYDVALESASVSGALKKLSDKDFVERLPATEKGKFLYKARK